MQVSLSPCRGRGQWMKICVHFLCGGGRRSSSGRKYQLQGTPSPADMAGHPGSEGNWDSLCFLSLSPGIAWEPAQPRASFGKTKFRSALCGLNVHTLFLLGAVCLLYLGLGFDHTGWLGQGLDCNSVTKGLPGMDKDLGSMLVP